MAQRICRLLVVDRGAGLGRPWLLHYFGGMVAGFDMSTPMSVSEADDG